MKNVKLKIRIWCVDILRSFELKSLKRNSSFFATHYQLKSILMWTCNVATDCLLLYHVQFTRCEKYENEIRCTFAEEKEGRIRSLHEFFSEKVFLIPRMFFRRELGEGQRERERLSDFIFKLFSFLNSIFIKRNIFSCIKLIFLWVFFFTLFYACFLQFGIFFLYFQTFQHAIFKVL